MADSLSISLLSFQALLHRLNRWQLLFEFQPLHRGGHYLELGDGDDVPLDGRDAIHHW